MVLHVPYGESGKQLKVSPHINSPSYLLPGRDGWPMLAEALSEVIDDDIESNGLVTVDGLSYTTPMTVTALDNDDRVFWGVYRGHKARNPGLTPFINLNAAWPKTSSLTLDFQQGMLVQVMPGEDVIPPLPWMSSAGDYDGGRSACIAYWLEHSLYWSSNNTVPASRTFTPPDWWQKAA